MEIKAEEKPLSSKLTKTYTANFFFDTCNSKYTSVRRRRVVNSSVNALNWENCLWLNIQSVSLTGTKTTEEVVELHRSLLTASKVKLFLEVQATNLPLSAKYTQKKMLREENNIR